MRTSTLSSMIIVLIVATSGASGRERAFRTTNPAPLRPAEMSSLCTFKSSQKSGYKTTAGERKICYLDCDGIQAAIAISAGESCSRHETMLIQGVPPARSSLAGRFRVNVALSSAEP